MQLAPFLVEHWLNTHELTARYNLAETDAKPFTVQELLELTGADVADLLGTGRGPDHRDGPCLEELSHSRPPFGNGIPRYYHLCIR